MKRLFFTFIFTAFALAMLSARTVSKSYLTDCRKYLNHPIFQNYSSDNLMDYYNIYVLHKGTPCSFDLIEEVDHIGQFNSIIMAELPEKDNTIDEKREKRTDVENRFENDDEYFLRRCICRQAHCIYRIFKQQEEVLRDYPLDVECLVKKLEEFKMKNTVLPVFFRNIETDYNGDIQRFVNAIAKESIFTNLSVINPGKGKDRISFFNDPGLLFAVGVRHHIKTIQLMLNEKVRADELVKKYSDPFFKSFPLFSSLSTGLYYGKEHTNKLLRWGPHFDRQMNKVLNFGEVLDQLTREELLGYIKTHQIDQVKEKNRMLNFLMNNDLIHPAYKEIIERKYRGKAELYVDAIFQESILTNKKELEKFLENPTSSRLAKDLGVQYVIHRLYYEASKY